MKLVHLADLHLGFRQYQRQTANGLNQREADVASAFRKAIDAVIELRPDIILIAGDVFHAVRPTNPAILSAYTHFARLVQMLPDPAVLVAWNSGRRYRSEEHTVSRTRPARVRRSRWSQTASAIRA